MDFYSIHTTRSKILPPLKVCRFLPIRVDNTNYQDATSRILTWAESSQKRYVCVANVHMVMEAHKSISFQNTINSSDLITPDGMPLVWAMRLLGNKSQPRVYGPTLTAHVCKAAAKYDISVGFYGSTPGTIECLVKNLSNRFPTLRIDYSYSPSFSPLKKEEDETTIKEINSSGAKILFVGLGCPKQEHWMFDHLGKINAVMIGVGAAFDFHSGMKKQAPDWMMSIGLEWLFRLCQEPKRLWRRYLFNNPQFLFLVGRQIIKERLLRN